MRIRVALVLVALGAIEVLAQEVPLGFGGPRRDGLPQEWKHVAFPSIPTPTSYAAVASGSGVVIRATTDAGASFLIRRAPDVDLARTPRLRWRWRVDRTIFAGDGRTRATDDFPARVWVGFECDWTLAGWLEQRWAQELERSYGFTPPGYWIHYVWTGRNRAALEGFDALYKPERFKCLALRTAADPIGEWLDEERDPRADFERLYNRPAPRIIAVAIMSDGDNTESRVDASFADIAFVAT